MSSRMRCGAPFAIEPECEGAFSASMRMPDTLWLSRELTRLCFPTFSPGRRLCLRGYGSCVNCI
jgi:hypothetical protein